MILIVHIFLSYHTYLSSYILLLDAILDLFWEVFGDFREGWITQIVFSVAGRYSYTLRFASSPDFAYRMRLRCVYKEKLCESAWSRDVFKPGRGHFERVMWPSCDQWISKWRTLGRLEAWFSVVILEMKTTSKHFLLSLEVSNGSTLLVGCLSAHAKFPRLMLLQILRVKRIFSKVKFSSWWEIRVICLKYVSWKMSPADGKFVRRTWPPQVSVFLHSRLKIGEISNRQVSVFLHSRVKIGEISNR